MSCWIRSACCSKAGRLTPPSSTRGKRDPPLVVEQQKGSERHPKHGAKQQQDATKAEAQAAANRKVSNDSTYPAHHFTIPVKSAVSPFSSKCRENSCPTATELFEP